MATVDESVENLRNFCAALAKTSSQLDEQNATLESETAGLSSLASESEARIGDFDEILETAIQELPQAAGDAEAAVEAVTDAATDLAQSRLASSQDDLESAHDDFDQQREEGQGELLDGFAQRLDAGFQDQANTVDEVEGELERIRAASQEDFDGLDEGLEGFAGRIEGARTSTGDALQDATSEIGGDVAEVEKEFGELTQQWDASIDQVLKSECQDVGSALDQAYSEWADGLNSAADALVQSVSDAIVGAAEFLGQDRSQAHEDALKEAIADGGDPLLAEMGEGSASLEAGQAVTEVLEPVVAELETALAVVDQIEELLKAME